MASHHHHPEAAITSKRNINNEDIYRMSRAAQILDNQDLLALYAADANESLTCTRARFLNIIHAAPPPVATSAAAPGAQAQAQRDAVNRGVEFPIQWAPTVGSPVQGTKAGPMIDLLGKAEHEAARLRVDASSSTPNRVKQESDQRLQQSKKKRSLPDEPDRRSSGAAASASGGTGNGKSPLYRSRVSAASGQQQSPKQSSNTRRKRRSALSNSP